MGGLGGDRFADGGTRIRGGLDVAPHLLLGHQTEPDLQVGVAQTEPICHSAKLFRVRIVDFLDAPVVRAARCPERVVDFLRLDVAVQEVIKQGFQLSAVLVGTPGLSLSHGCSPDAADGYRGP